MAGSSLYTCAVNGDIDTLRRLVDEDASLLEKVGVVTGSKDGILHIAAASGHAGFVETVLRYKPELAGECNEQGFTPLHQASSRGYVDVVRVILEADPDVSLSKDKDGMIPAHIAAMKGKLGALQEILSVNPWCVKDRTAKGETILHLSVKFNKLEVVMFLLGLEEVRESVNAVDGNGNTVLHLAAARNQMEMINALVGSGLSMDLNAVNAYEINPFELYCRRWRALADDEIRNLLRPIINPQRSISDGLVVPILIGHAHDDEIRPPAAESTQRASGLEIWMKQSENVMLVAILIATVSFQAALTPPGGLWQDDSNNKYDAVVSPHQAGRAILAGTPHYENFMAFNAAAFVFSLMVILCQLIMKASFVSSRAMVFAMASNMLFALAGFAAAFYCGIGITQNENFWRHLYRVPELLLCIAVAGGIFLITIVATKVVGCCCRRRSRA